MPTPPSPSLPASPWVRAWSLHEKLNCYGGHGASDLPSPTGGVQAGVEACREACLATAECDGIVTPRASTHPSGKDADGVSCYLRRDIAIRSCHASTGYDTHTVMPWPPSPPTPPAPPTAPPPPPLPPISHETINARMHSDEGILLHQIDDYLFGDGASGDQDGHCHGCNLGYVAASLIHSKMKHHWGGRIPIYDINGAGAKGGIVLRPGVLDITCMYGADASTWNLPSSARGCDRGHSWCDEFAHVSRSNPCPNHDYKCHCCTQFQCSGQSQLPWSGAQQTAFLDLYSRFGGKAPCCGSGYNEVILPGGREWNAVLPEIVEAFYYEASFGAHTKGYIKWLHGSFTKHHHLSASSVPVLELHRHNFDHPFSPG